MITKENISNQKFILTLIIMILLAACGGTDPEPTQELLPEIPNQEKTSTYLEPTSTIVEQEPTIEIPTQTESAPPAPTNAPDQGFTFELIPNWTAGEKLTYVIVNERTDTNQGAIQIEAGSRTPVDIRVLEQTDEGYILEWIFGETVIDNDSAAANPMLDALLKLGNGMRVEYEVDQMGTPANVINWEEIQTTMESAFTEIISELENQGLNQEELNQIRALIEPTFSSQEQIEIFATQEILLFHLIYGWPAFESSTPITYEDLLPNPFGGEPFPSTGKFELGDYESGADRVTINWSRELDPESTREILMQTFTDMATAMGSDPPGESDLPSPFVIEDSGIFVIETDTGWPESIDQVRKIEIGPSMRIESTKFIADTE